VTVRPDVIVVGAGLAGLSLARELRSDGRRVLVLERSRVAGGRCATRRLDGQPVDHGLPFLHGREPAFVAELEAARGGPARGEWPVAVTGSGLPCRPAAFEPGSARLAPAAGVRSFAERLALGTDVRHEANVASLRAVPEAGAAREWNVVLDSGETLRAGAVALALPAPSAAELLAGMAPRPAEADALLPLLAMVQVLPCLAVIARYPEGTPPPGWELSLPAGATVLHSVLHDSAKRGPGARLVLVLQANPRWSRAHLEEAPEDWARILVGEAARLHGEWIASPESVTPHAWRRARVAEGTELSAPLAVTLGGGALLGLCGDGFHPRGGAEGAFLSGRALAARFRQLLSVPS
jgi:renalase